jgi:hypothetical protein
METERSFERPLVGPEVGSLAPSVLVPKVVGVHPTLGAKLECVCDSPAGRLEGDSLDRISGVMVVGRSDREEEEIPYIEGLIVGVQVIFNGASPPLFLLYRTAPMLIEVVVAKAAMATRAMIAWVKIDIPAAKVAAVAIVPAAVAADVPADVAAWTAID